MSSNPRHNSESDCDIPTTSKKITDWVKSFFSRDRSKFNIEGPSNSTKVTNRVRSPYPRNSSESDCDIPSTSNKIKRRIKSRNRRLSTRSYKQARNAFTVTHDSYIVAGCIHLDVGRWKDIISIFPFPPSFTNITIKDRSVLIQCSKINSGTAELTIKVNASMSVVLNPSFPSNPFLIFR